MTNFDNMRDRLLARAGLSDPPPQPLPGYTIEDLYRTQWSSEFERYMRNRLVIGALRYGGLGLGNKRQFDRIGSIRRRLDAYEKTGNLEMLVDSANLALVEYVEGDHPLRHWNTDDTGEHVQSR